MHSSSCVDFTFPIGQAEQKGPPTSFAAYCPSRHTQPPLLKVPAGDREFSGQSEHSPSPADTVVSVLHPRGCTLHAAKTNLSRFCTFQVRRQHTRQRCGSAPRALRYMLHAMIPTVHALGRRRSWRTQQRSWDGSNSSRGSTCRCLHRSTAVYKENSASECCGFERAGAADLSPPCTAP